MKKFIARHSTLFFLIGGFFICLYITLPYFHNGYFPTHDGEWAVVRASEMFREIRDYQFPPRYSGVLNLGYGYPLFNFAYPFPYYITTIIHAAHFGFVDSVKIIFVSSVFISFIGMFFLSRVFWKSSLAGFLSGIFYILLPYHLVDLYVRGSIGESIAFALYPLILLSCLGILYKKYINVSYLSLSILSGLLILNHNISAVYFGLIFAFYLIALFLAKQYKEAVITFTGFVWGVLISAFFFAPALLEKKYIKLSKIPIADRNLYFVTLQKLLVPAWGYGAPIDANPFTYQIGIPQLVGFFSSIFIVKKLRAVEQFITYSFIFLTVVLTFMMFSFTSFMWKLPLLSDINYPWTLLLPIGFLVSFLSGSLIYVKYKKIIVPTLLLVVIFLYGFYARPSGYINKGDLYYLTNLATTTSSNELMPLWVKDEPVNMFDQKIEGKGEVSSITYNSKRIDFLFTTDISQRIVVNQIYYPGWSATVNDRRVKIYYNNKNGLMNIEVPKGKSKVSLSFSEIPLRRAINILSLAAFILLFLVFAIVELRKRIKK